VNFFKRLCAVIISGAQDTAADILLHPMMLFGKIRKRGKINSAGKFENGNK
jgi:hypothetical protein